MTQEQSYKHITVTADDDDEIVIHAGASRAPACEGEAEFVYESAESADQSLDAEALEDAREDVGGWPEDSPEKEASEDEAFDQETAEAPSATVRAPQYRETTQEDLDSVGPRSTTQKAVIGGVIVFLIAFIVYYVFIM